MPAHQQPLIWQAIFSDNVNKKDDIKKHDTTTLFLSLTINNYVL